MPPSVFLTTLKLAPLSRSLPRSSRELGHREAAVVADEQVLRVGQQLRHLGDHSFFLVSQHLDLSVANKNPLPKRERAQAASAGSSRLGWRTRVDPFGSRRSTDRHRPRRRRRREAAVYDADGRGRNCRAGLRRGRAAGSAPRAGRACARGRARCPGPSSRRCVTLLMYLPLAAAGLARTISSSTAP